MSEPTAADRAASVTAEAFAALGEGRRELIGGRVVEMTPAGGRHGEVAMELAFLVKRHVREHGLGRVYAAETGFILSRDPDTVRAPDVAFVARDRVVECEGFLPQAPDLAVEVLSPGDRYGEVDEKIHQWLAAGSRQVWVVDPRAERIQVFRRDDHPLDLGLDDQLEGGAVLPGFAVGVRAVLHDGGAGAPDRA